MNRTCLSSFQESVKQWLCPQQHGEGHIITTASFSGQQACPPTTPGLSRPVSHSSPPCTLSAAVWSQHSCSFLLQRPCLFLLQAAIACKRRRVRIREESESSRCVKQKVSGEGEAEVKMCGIFLQPPPPTTSHHQPQPPFSMSLSAWEASLKAVQPPPTPTSITKQPLGHSGVGR